MPIQPRDLDSFFRRLGEKRVEKWVVNGEITGAELDSAKLWLDHKRGRAGLGLNRWSLALGSLIGLLGLAASSLING